MPSPDHGDPSAKAIFLEGPDTITIQNGGNATQIFTLSVTGVTTTIHLSATGLPEGVTAVFSPVSVHQPAASQTISMLLKAEGNTLATETTIHVRAASGNVSSSVPVALTVNSPFSFVFGGPVLQIGTSGYTPISIHTLVKMAAFGQIHIPLNLVIEDGLTGTIALLVSTALPAGVSAQFNRSILTVNGTAGIMAVYLALTAGPEVTLGTVNTTVLVRVDEEDRSAFTFPLAVIAPFISNVSPVSGAAPMFERPGTLVKISGGGFGPGTTATFGQSTAVAASAISHDGTSLSLRVPADAVSGAITVTSPAGVAAGPDYAIDNYRNTRGFSWQNSVSFQDLVGGDYSYADATALFGARQTVNIITGSVFGTPTEVNVLAPFVEAFLGAVNMILDSNGQCFGMVRTSLLFATKQLNAATFPQQPPDSEPGGPAGPDVWTLNGPPLGEGDNVSPALAALVHRQHMAQFSQEMINQCVNFHAGVFTAAALRAAILQAFNSAGGNGIGAMIALNHGTDEGHIVIGFDLIDKPGGNFDILVYNPNVPFRAGEDEDAPTHAGRLAANVIKVKHDGSWVLPHSDVVFGPGTPNWAGSIFTITVIPWNTIPLVPTFPMLEVVAAGVIAATLASTLMAFVFGDAAISQVGDAHGHKLLADGKFNTEAATMLMGARPMPAFGGLGRKSIPLFASTRQDPLSHSISGNASGTYTMNSLGHGVVMTLSDIPTLPGAIDIVSIHQGAVKFTGSHDKPLALTLLGAGKNSKLPRTATLKTHSSAGAAMNFSFDRENESFTYIHEGVAADYSIEFSSHDSHGRPTKFTTPLMAVAKDDKLTFLPDWEQLSAGGGTVNLHSTAGRIATRPLSGS